MTFDPRVLLGALAEHGVEFVVIGQMAALLHGHPETTFDLDVVPRQDIDNAERLIEALRGQEAVLVVEGERTDGPDERQLLGWNLVREYDTAAGPIDVVPFAIGVGDFDTLSARAADVVIDGHRVLVASLDDVIASKEAAARPKDLRQLPALRAFRDRLRDREG